MVLQRWQSLLLFIAVVLMGIFSVSAYGVKESPDMLSTGIYASENTGYWFLNILTAVVLFIAIFMFKKLNAQKCLVLLACGMMGASAIWGYNYLHRLSVAPVECHLTYTWILLIVAFGLSVISLFLIGADQKLLKSYDRIR